MIPSGNQNVACKITQFNDFPSELNLHLQGMFPYFPIFPHEFPIKTSRVATFDMPRDYSWSPTHLSRFTVFWENIQINTPFKIPISLKLHVCIYISYHIISYHIISYIILYYIIYYFIYYIILYYIMLCYVMLCYIMLYTILYIILYYIILYYSILYYIYYILFYILYYIILCYVILY